MHNTKPQYQGEQLDYQWLQSVLKSPHAIKSVTYEKGGDRLVGMCSIQRICVTFATGTETTTQTYIFKQISSDQPQQLQMSLLRGLTREVTFYRVAGDLGFDMSLLPKCYYAFSDEKTGEKYLILEDLAPAVEGGALFGDGNPSNWEKKGELEKICSQFITSDRTLENYIENSFNLLGKIHAQFWNKKNILESQEWLWGHDWWFQNGKMWNKIQEDVLQKWKKIRSSMNSSGLQENGCQWDLEFVEIVDASVKKISWENFVKSRHEACVTLLTGDCHAGNFMWFPPPSKNVRIIDMEESGVGSGPQDLAQFMISHPTPEFRRSCEKNLLRKYFEELRSHGVSNYTFDDCLRDYTQGGSEKWIGWCVLIAANQPPKVSMFFNNQTFQFCKDHNITPANVGQPRV